jgi:hypothetical protein
MTIIRRLKNLTVEDKTSPTYDGVGDTEYSVWRTEEYLNKKFDEYNRRFFGGKLTKIPVKFQGRSTKRYGWYSAQLANSKQIRDSVMQEAEEKGLRSWEIRNLLDTRLHNELRVKSEGIFLTNANWKDRYTMEGVLVHEMCHEYQYEVLCEFKQSKVTLDAKLGSGSFGHGPKFFEAAEMVNSSPENVEGFHITQYGAPDDATRLAYKKADGYLYVSIEDGKVVNIRFTTDAKRKPLRSMFQYEYEFQFTDGQAKADLKPTKDLKIDIRSPRCQTLAKAILDGKLQLVRYKKEFEEQTQMDFQENMQKNPDSILGINGTMGVRCSEKVGKALLSSTPTHEALELLRTVIDKLYTKKYRSVDDMETYLSQCRLRVDKCLLAQVLQFLDDGFLGLYTENMGPESGVTIKSIVDGYKKVGLDELEDVLYDSDKDEFFNWLDNETEGRVF